MYKVKKAVIPAAGLGTRFLPITKAIPKPMLSVFDKPTVQYILDELKSIGIEETVIVVSPDSDVIEKHFAENKSLKERLLSDGKKSLYEIELETESYNVKFVTQPTANGLAGAILAAKPYIGDEPFVLLLGDELLYASEGQTPCVKRLTEVFEKTGKSVIATMEVFGDDVSKYGNIGVKDEVDGIIEVESIIEKPSINEALSNYAIIGRYVMASGVMGMIEKLTPKSNELSFSDVLDELGKKGELLASCFEGKRYDVGDKVGYVKANVEFALLSPQAKEEVKEYVKKLAAEL